MDHFKRQALRVTLGFGPVRLWQWLWLRLESPALDLYISNFDISGGCCCSVVVAIKVVLLSCWPVLSEVLLSTLFSTTPFCDNDDDGLLTP